jgi:uncharacterized membrane protein
MNEIIKRYIDDVIRRLPVEERSQVELSLKDKIESHLKDENSMDEIEDVLKKLGHPKDVANQYRLKKRYLVAPEQFDDYLYVLKIVAIVILSLSVIGFFVSIIILLIMGTNFHQLGSHITSWIGRTFSILTFAFFVITVTFHFFEKEEGVKKKTLFFINKCRKSIEMVNLRKSKRMSILSLIFKIFLSIIFVILIINYLNYIGWYEDGELIASLFNYWYVVEFLPYIIIAFIIHFISSAIKLFFNYWNIFLGIVHTFSKVINVIVILIFLNFAGIFNHGFFIVISQFANSQTEVVLEGLEVAVLIISVVLVLVLIANLMLTWSNVFNKKKLYKS